MKRSHHWRPFLNSSRWDQVQTVAIGRRSCSGFVVQQHCLCSVARVALEALAATRVCVVSWDPSLPRTMQLHPGLLPVIIQQYRTAATDCAGAQVLSGGNEVDVSMWSHPRLLTAPADAEGVGCWMLQVNRTYRGSPPSAWAQCWTSPT